MLGMRRNCFPTCTEPRLATIVLLNDLKVQNLEGHECTSHNRYAYTKGADFEAEVGSEIKLYCEFAEVFVSQAWLQWLRGTRPGLQLPSADTSSNCRSELPWAQKCRMLSRLRKHLRCC